MRVVNLSILVGAALAAVACAQQPVYTQPYTTAPPVAFTSPQPVTLTVNYTRDGKADPKRTQEITAVLTDSLAAGNGFKPAAAGESGGHLDVGVEDNATAKRGLLAGFTATVGHLMLGGAEFTPQGRRTMRELAVVIRYTPAGGAPLERDYASPIVSITNNTQEPSDLVPLQDRQHAEATLIGNDLNLFMAEFAKGQAPAVP